MTTSGSDLAVAAQRYYRDQADLAEVAAVFHRTRVAFQRAREPGALVVHTTRFGPWLCGRLLTGYGLRLVVATMP